MGKNSPWDMTGRFEIPILLLVGAFAVFLAGNFSFLQNPLSLPQTDQPIGKQTLIVPTTHPGSGIEQGSFSVVTTTTPESATDVGDVGYCRLDLLKNAFHGDSAKATVARCICIHESNGITTPNENNLNCLAFGPHHSRDYSIGIFQINALVHCPGSVGYPACQAQQDAFDSCEQRNPQLCEPLYKTLVSCQNANLCVVEDKNKLDTCINPPSDPSHVDPQFDGWQDPLINMEKMAQLSNNGNNWSPWDADSKAQLGQKDGCF